MSPRVLLFSLAAVVAMVGFVVHLAARRGHCSSARKIDRVTGHVLWTLAIAALAIGVLNPSPLFDRPTGNVPGAIALLMISSVVIVVGVTLLRTSLLRQARRAAGRSPAASTPHRVGAA